MKANSWFILLVVILFCNNYCVASTLDGLLRVTTSSSSLTASLLSQPSLGIKVSEDRVEGVISALWTGNKDRVASATNAILADTSDGADSRNDCCAPHFAVSASLDNAFQYMTQEADATADQKKNAEHFIECMRSALKAGTNQVVAQVVLDAVIARF